MMPLNGPTFNLAVAFLVLASSAAAQPLQRTLVVEVLAEGDPIPGATVTVSGAVLATDTEGRAVFQVPGGEHEVAASMPGYLAAAERITVAEGIATTTMRITLQELPEIEETVIVTATRTNTRLQDQPVRVEVIDRE